ncbi:ALDH-like protein [Hymenopellis radicata]|nr:ALDH-like protein [Hymenopellis radicata]
MHELIYDGLARDSDLGALHVLQTLCCPICRLKSDDCDIILLPGQRRSFGAADDGVVHPFDPVAQISIERRPLGVILSCAPWNLPGGLSVLTTFYPIIFGNTVVLKPSEYAPRSPAFILDALRAAVLPSGVFNFIPMSRDSSPELIPISSCIAVYARSW